MRMSMRKEPEERGNSHFKWVQGQIKDLGLGNQAWILSRRKRNENKTKTNGT